MEVRKFFKRLFAITLSAVIIGTVLSDDTNIISSFAEDNKAVAVVEQYGGADTELGSAGETLLSDEIVMTVYDDADDADEGEDGDDEGEDGDDEGEDGDDGDDGITPDDGDDTPADVIPVINLSADDLTVTYGNLDASMINIHCDYDTNVSFRIATLSGDVIGDSTELGVGQYLICPFIQDTELVYNAGTVTNGVLTVTARPITIGANDADIVCNSSFADVSLSASVISGSWAYNDADAVTVTAAWNVEHPVLGELLDGVCHLTEATYDDAILPDVVDNGGVLGNYDVSLTNGSLTVMPKMVNLVYYLIKPGKNITLSEPTDPKKMVGQNEDIFVRYGTGSFKQYDDAYKTITEKYGTNFGFYNEGEGPEYVVESLLTSPMATSLPSNYVYTFGTDKYLLDTSLPVDWYVIKLANKTVWHVDGVAAWILLTPDFNEELITVPYNGEAHVDDVKAAIIAQVNAFNEVMDGDLVLDTSSYNFIEDIIDVKTNGNYLVKVNGTYTAFGRSTETNLTFEVKVIPAEVTVTVTGNEAEYTYDGTTKSVEGYDITTDSELYDLSAVTLKDDVDTVVSAINAGTYTAGLTSDAFNVASDANFAVTVEVIKDITLIINPVERPITIVAGSNFKIYDGEALTDNAYTYTEGILLDGHTLTAVVEGTITDVGTADNVVTDYAVVDEDGNDVTACYSFSNSLDGLLVVEARPVAITVDNKTKMFGRQDPEFTASVSNVLEGDEVVYECYREEGNERVGSYPIFARFDAEAYPNYAITVVDGRLTISSIPVVPTPPTPEPEPDPTPDPVPPTVVTPPTPTPVPPTPENSPVVEPEDTPEPVVEEQTVDPVPEDEALAEISDEETPLASNDVMDIADEETPLANSEDGCWIHWLILIGTLVYIVYAGLRVWQYNRKKDDENETKEDSAE